MPRDRESAKMQGPLRGRFYFVIVSFLMLLGVTPFLEMYPTFHFITDVMMAVVFLTLLYAVIEQRGFLVLAVFLLPFLISLASKYWIRSPLFDHLASLSGAAFIAFSLFAIARYIYRREEVSADVIGAAIVFYLLMGLMWSIVFEVLEYFEPGSFQMGDAPYSGERMPFVYYSFVTLTTLGYGDITPITPRACALSIIEAIVGQLYLVIQIAWLVGMHISRTMEKKTRQTGPGARRRK